MSSKYWDIPMNWIGGCSPCAVGCAHCWATDCASKRLANHPLYKGLTKNGKWTGEIRVMPELIKVIGGKPKTIFWNNMSDMFHDKVSFKNINKAFSAMFNMPQHTHLILTKRIKRMLEYQREILSGYLQRDNIHLGATICTQKEADEILPIALQIPGFDWVSAEPLLGAIDFIGKDKSRMGKTGYLANYLRPWYCGKCGQHLTYPPSTVTQTCNYCGTLGHEQRKSSISRIVVGCESGPRRRPCKLEHIRSIVEQCKAAGVGCYVKQMPMWKYEGDNVLYETIDEADKCGTHFRFYSKATIGKRPKLKQVVEHDMSKFPKWAQVREEI